MLSYICDRCGKLIPRPTNEQRYVVEFGTAVYDDYMEEHGIEVESWDLCNSCQSSFVLWKHMYIMEKEDEEEKE